MWDNHEFSWQGWQRLQKFDGSHAPAQTRKVAANQAFFEYQPGAMFKPSDPSLEQFDPPHVVDAPVDAIRRSRSRHRSPTISPRSTACKGYRALRWGRNVELIITDQRSYRSEDPPAARDQAASPGRFPDFIPEEVVEILDAGRTYNNGHPRPDLVRRRREIANFRREQPPQTMLGAKQKAWFLDRLQTSNATWKIWGNTIGTLDMRVDPQNLPPGIAKPWPGAGYAAFGWVISAPPMWSAARSTISFATHGITGFAIVAGDRHSFWAGLAAKSLAAQAVRAGRHRLRHRLDLGARPRSRRTSTAIPKDDPIASALSVGQGPGGCAARNPRSICCCATASSPASSTRNSGDLAKARALSNPDLSPHVSFVDMGGHGYAVVTRHEHRTSRPSSSASRARSSAATDADGGPLRYRSKQRANLWAKGETPKLDVKIFEGDAKFSI